MTGSALAQGWVRLARATVLGGASLFLASAAHVLGGGSLPGAGLMVIASLVLGVISVSLTTRRLRFPALVAVLGVEQALLHLVFHAATAASSCAPVTTPGHAMPGHTMPGHTLPGHTLSAVCGSGGQAVTGWSMLIGHAVAVLATAWLLARGEQWLWRVVERVHRYAAARPARRRWTWLAPVAVAMPRPLTPSWAPAGPRGPPLR